VASSVEAGIVFPKTCHSRPTGMNPKVGSPFVVISQRAEIERVRRIPTQSASQVNPAIAAAIYVELPWGSDTKNGLRQKRARALLQVGFSISPDDVEWVRHHSA